MTNLQALTTTGLKKSDPRLKEMMETLKLVQKEESADVTKLSFEEFRGLESNRRYNIAYYKLCFRIIQSSVSLLFRAFNQEFIIPDFEEFTKHIEDIYLKCANNTDGQV